MMKFRIVSLGIHINTKTPKAILEHLTLFTSSFLQSRNTDIEIIFLANISKSAANLGRDIPDLNL